MVMKKARPRLNALAQLAPQLNVVTDHYMDNLKKIEDELRGLNLGIKVECNDYFQHTGDEVEEEDGLFFFAWFLGFGKDNNSRQWGLLAIRCKVPVDGCGRESVETVPLLQAPRDIRIAACNSIPALLEELYREAKAKIDSLQRVSDR